MIAGGLVLAFCFTFIAGILNEENADTLMAGYNTMSDERKKKVDFKGLTLLFKQTFYTMAVLIAVLSLLQLVVEEERILIVSIILISSFGPASLMIRSKQYDSNSYKKWEMPIQYSVISILVAGGIVLSFLLWTQPP